MNSVEYFELQNDLRDLIQENVNLKAENKELKHSLKGRPTDGWMLTFTGETVTPLDPQIEQIWAKDITHSLAYICRFNGHSYTHYSVAEHSVRVASAVNLATTDKTIIKQALIHDAVEAYLQDIINPIKRWLIGYSEAEERLSKIVHEYFNVPFPDLTQGKLIKHWDTVLLATELRDLLHAPEEIYKSVSNCLGSMSYTLEECIVPITAEVAEQAFISMWEKLNA